MTQIAYSELTKRYYFLPAKGRKIDITDDILEILKYHHTIKTDQNELWKELISSLSQKHSGTVIGHLKQKYSITKNGA